MKRDEIYSAIDRERESQDAAWRTGRSNEAQYQYAASHILLLEEQGAILRRVWYGAKEEGSIRERLIKTAAIAVRALEEISVV